MSEPKKPAGDRSWADDVTESAPEAGFSFSIGEAKDALELGDRERYDADEMADDQDTQQYAEQAPYDGPNHGSQRGTVADDYDPRLGPPAIPSKPDRDGNVGDPYKIKARPKPDKDGMYRP